MKIQKSILRQKVRLSFSIRLLIAVLTAAVLAACSGMPNAGSAVWGNLGRPTDQVPFMENVRTGTLPSGLRYFILENARPENRAYLTLAVKAGSVLEEEHERGLAHFVEHMAFNGTERFPEAELINYLRSLGMRFGPEINAYTSFDETVYGIEVPVESDDDGLRRIPDTALAVIDDWTRAITFTPKDVDDERNVITEEYRSGLGVSERIRQHWVPMLLRGSPYAERLPIGQMEIVQGAPASDLENFYKKWYQADNMALILVGDFDGEALEASLGDHFSIPRPASPTRLPGYDLPPPQKGNIETLVLTDPEMTNTWVHLYFKREREAPRGDLAYFRNEIIDIIIDRMLGFRFEDAAVKPETPYANAGAGHSRYGASSRFYVTQARAKTGKVEASLEELLRAKESMLRYGFTDSELSIAARSLISDAQQMVMEKDRQQSGRFINFLSGYYLNGGNCADAEWELNALRELLPHITAKDINAAIKDYFASDDVQAFIFAPDAEQASLPDDARITQMVRASRKMKIERPRSGIVDGALLRTVPERGSITAESVDEETGALVWELSNGAQVILQSTTNKNDEIILLAMARGGLSSAPAEDDVSVSLAVEMAQVSGLGPWPLPEISRKLADKQISFSQWIDWFNRGFQASAVSADLKTLFESLYLGITDLRIDPIAVEAMIERYATSLAHRNEDPGTVFSDEINRIVYSGHPRLQPLKPEDLPQVDIGTALAFIRKGFNPADYTLVFTGNLNMDIMRDYVETYVASIPRGETWNEWDDLGIQRPGKVEKIVHKGKEEQSQVYMTWFTTMPFTEETAVTATVLSEYLDIVMTEEIREKLGGVYGISVGASAAFIPKDEASMAVYFSCDPKRAEELSAAVINVLQQTAGGVNRDTFGKAAEALKKGWETSMQSNTYIAHNYANLLVMRNEPLSRLHRQPEYIEGVTPEDIQQMCEQLLRNGPARVVLMPE